MTWLFFMDESGHDHKHLPYEVRGGVAIHVSKLWNFVRSMQGLERDSFGIQLSEVKKEIKGHKLLDKDRIAWSKQSAAFPDEQRRSLCRKFFTKGLEKLTPTQDEFTAYGQACLEMARGMFLLLRDHGARIFAAAIPCGTMRPDSSEAGELLRKDHVFLFERYFYFLESKQEHGLLVMDESDKTEDRRFVRRLQDYFSKTANGRYRTRWIVPTPLFVASDMNSGVQAADLCCYAINRGFRLPTRGMGAATRPEIEEEFGPWLRQLQASTTVTSSQGESKLWSIVFVPDPYHSRQK